MAKFNPYGWSVKALLLLGISVLAFSIRCEQRAALAAHCGASRLCAAARCAVPRSLRGRQPAA